MNLVFGTAHKAPVMQATYEANGCVALMLSSHIGKVPLLGEGLNRCFRAGIKIKTLPKSAYRTVMIFFTCNRTFHLFSKYYKKFLYFHFLIFMFHSYYKLT